MVCQPFGKAFPVFVTFFFFINHGGNIEGGGNVLHHVHRVRALLVFVFLLLFAGGLRLRFGKNALRLFAFPENGLVQAFRKGFPDHFTERRLALVHFAFVIKYQNIRFQSAKRTHAPAAVARVAAVQRPRRVDTAHKTFIAVPLG